MTPLSSHELVNQPLATVAKSTRQSSIPKISPPVSNTSVQPSAVTHPSAVKTVSHSSVAQPTQAAQTAQPVQLPLAAPSTNPATSTPRNTGPSKVDAVATSLQSTADSIKQRFASTKFDFWNREKSTNNGTMTNTNSNALPVASAVTADQLPVSKLANKSSSTLQRNTSTESNTLKSPIQTFTVDDNGTTTANNREDDFDEISAYVAALNKKGGTNDNTSLPLVATRNRQGTDASSNNEDFEQQLSEALSSRLDVPDDNKLTHDPTHVSRDSLPPPDFGLHPALDLLSDSPNKPTNVTDDPDTDNQMSKPGTVTSQIATHDETSPAAPLTDAHIHSELEEALKHHEENEEENGELDDEAAEQMLASLQAELNEGE